MRVRWTLSRDRPTSAVQLPIELIAIAICASSSQDELRHQKKIPCGICEMHCVRKIRSACEMRCGALEDLFHFTLQPKGAIFHNSRSELFHIRRKPNISLEKILDL